ncbi:MAG: phage tail sheath family protein [Acetatifactor sp.]|nr:phage tail sheath family protein [Acetatifactor sp.]
MALGGGKWTSQNKELPGSYINHISLATASAALSDRGICTMPLELDWGADDKVFTVTNEEFQKNSLALLGYAYTDDRLKGLRDLFAGAKTLYAYRLNSGGEKAKNDYATARYSGVRGNALKIVIRTNADDESMFDVLTYMDTEKVDEQTVANASGLIANDYVTFQTDMGLELSAGMPLTGGTNGDVTGGSYQSYADRIESFRYNTMGIVTDDAKTISLFNAFNKRMRDEEGMNFQLVTYRNPADYLGIISVKNKTTDTGWPEASLVYWVTGKQCSCPVQSSLEAVRYNGEFTPDTSYTQADLKKAIKNGEFVLHNVDENVEVLVDINTLVTTTENCGDVFKENQTVRVIDQLGNDDAVCFNGKYRGKVPNDAAGRNSLWSDLVKIRKELLKLRAIENFSDTDVSVSQGETKKSIVVESTITVVNAMSQMYMTNVVK